MRNQETGLNYANTDPSRHFNNNDRFSGHWFNAWIWCLQHDDEEAAHLIRLRNDAEYAEEWHEASVLGGPIGDPHEAKESI